jgi:hypothetical protein
MFEKTIFHLLALSCLTVFAQKNQWEQCGGRKKLNRIAHKINLVSILR